MRGGGEEEREIERMRLGCYEASKDSFVENLSARRQRTYDELLFRLISLQDRFCRLQVKTLQDDAYGILSEFQYFSCEEK